MMTDEKACCLAASTAAWTAVGTAEPKVATMVGMMVAEKESYWAASMAGDWAATKVAEWADR